MHLLALLGLFTDLTDRFPLPFHIRKVPLTGGVSPYKPLYGEPLRVIEKTELLVR